MLLEEQALEARLEALRLEVQQKTNFSSGSSAEDQGEHHPLSLQPP
jgi:hypothetical protein